MKEFQTTYPLGQSSTPILRPSNNPKSLVSKFFHFCQGAAKCAKKAFQNGRAESKGSWWEGVKAGFNKAIETFSEINFKHIEEKGSSGIDLEVEAMDDRTNTIRQSELFINIKFEDNVRKELYALDLKSENGEQILENAVIYCRQKVTESIKTAGSEQPTEESINKIIKESTEEFKSKLYHTDSFDNVIDNLSTPLEMVVSRFCQEYHNSHKEEGTLELDPKILKDIEHLSRLSIKASLQHEDRGNFHNNHASKYEKKAVSDKINSSVKDTIKSFFENHSEKIYNQNINISKNEINQNSNNINTDQSTTLLSINTTSSKTNPASSCNLTATREVITPEKLNSINLTTQKVEASVENPNKNSEKELSKDEESQNSRSFKI